MNINVTLYKEPKYELGTVEVLTEFYYKNIQSYEIITGGEKLFDIEKILPSECFDNYCQYLLITLEEILW